MTRETAEKRNIKQYLGWMGCFCYYNLQGIGSFKGVPDLTAITKTGKVLQIEVKAGGYSQSEHQKRFQQEWEALGGIYICGDLSAVQKWFGENKEGATK